jgi:hypothetical protein
MLLELTPDYDIVNGSGDSHVQTNTRKNKKEQTLEFCCIVVAI